MIDLPQLGFGCWAIGGHGYGEVADSESIAALHTAWDSGVRLFDTADIYGFGHSEKVLAQALGQHRHEALIATKGGVCWEDSSARTWKDCSASALRRALEGSLRRLRLDCIPLYQLHWHDGKTPMAEIRLTLEAFQAEGKVRWVGCSNLDADMLRAPDAPHFDTIQLPYSMVRQEAEVLMKWARARGMRTIAYDVLARGLLTGKFTGEDDWPEKDTRGSDPVFQGELFARGRAAGEQVRALAKRLGKDPAAVAVRWALQREAVDCAVVGCKTAAQVTANFSAMHWALADEEIALLGIAEACSA